MLVSRRSGYYRSAFETILIPACSPLASHPRHLPRRTLTEPRIGPEGQELLEGLVQHELIEQLGGVQASLAEGRNELVAQAAVEVVVDVAAVRERDVVAPPLPELRPRDLGGRHILHEPVDRGCARAGEPGLE